MTSTQQDIHPLGERRERPILFSAPMVRALLAGTKTQTRRVLKPQPSSHHWSHLPGYELKQTAPTLMADGRIGIRFHHTIPQNPEWDSDRWVMCPYGQPGDRLWVRESWAYNPDLPGIASRACFMADPEHKHDGLKWKPSIHMPRAVCRIVLVVAEVRVERLQDISEADARAEGVEPMESDAHEERDHDDLDEGLCTNCGGLRLYTAFDGASLGALPDTDCTRCDTHAKRYRHLWNSINLAPSPVQERQDGQLVTVGYVSYPWSLDDFERRYGPEVVESRLYRGKPLTITPNPWLWVISFKREAA